MTTSQQSLFTFNADLEAFSQKMQLDLELVIKRTVFDLFTRIVLKTPVDTGRARASWGLERSQPGNDVMPATFKGASPETAASIAQQQLLKMNTARSKITNSTWWIYNNLPYIIALEYGHSKQAPNGMVRVALAEVEALTG